MNVSKYDLQCFFTVSSGVRQEYNVYSDDHFVLSVTCWIFITRFLPCYSVSEFRSGKISILVATDVAARGLGKYSSAAQGLIYVFQSCVDKWVYLLLLQRKDLCYTVS